MIRGNGQARMGKQFRGERDVDEGLRPLRHRKARAQRQQLADAAHLRPCLRWIKGVFILHIGEGPDKL